MMLIDNGGYADDAVDDIYVVEYGGDGVVATGCTCDDVDGVGDGDDDVDDDGGDGGDDVDVDAAIAVTVVYDDIDTVIVSVAVAYVDERGDDNDAGNGENDDGDYVGGYGILVMMLTMGDVGVADYGGDDAYEDDYGYDVGADGECGYGKTDDEDDCGYGHGNIGDDHGDDVVVAATSKCDGECGAECGDNCGDYGGDDD